jgi:hypothetical protein
MKTLLSIILTSLSFGVFSQEFEELIKVVAGDRAVDDRYGWSVDIDGDFAVVGAYGDDFAAADPNMGSAYILQKVGTEWIQIQKIFSTDRDDYDRFGWSVAIDGDYIIVGAYQEDHNLADADPRPNAGSAYIFERNEDGVWVQVQKIIAGDRIEGDEFGYSVAIHGTTAVVGAHIDDRDAAGLGFMYHAGSAYIFDRAGDGTWSQTQKIVASDRSPGFEYAPDHEDWNDRFGESVAIWNDYIAVGGPYASKAYAFERSGGVWTQVSMLTYPGISWLDRAAPVAIDSNVIALGAQTEDLDEFGLESIMNSGGGAVFTRGVAGGWSYLQKLSPDDRDAGDHFGWSITIDLPFIAVGTHSDNHDEFGDDEIENTGSIYIFELQDDGTFIEVTKLDASDRAMDDELGISVAISGNTIISGAFQQDFLPGGGGEISDAGAVYFYTTDPDDAGCTPVSSDQEVEICSGGTYVIGGSTYSEPGVYTNVLTTDDGCDSTVTTYLYFSDPIFAEQALTICEGDFIIVGESMYFDSGVYEDVLTTEDGCDSTVVTFLEVEEVFPFYNSVLLCEGQSVVVGDNTYSEEGTYEDVLISESGCDSLVITFINVGEAINTEVLVDGDVLEAASGISFYQWVRCEPFEIIDGATDQFYTTTEPGLYAVILTSDECQDTSDCILMGTSGVTDQTANFNVKVFPNPSNGVFVISGYNTTGNQVQIYNVRGELIYESILAAEQTLINLQNQAKGLYLVRITTEDGFAVQKIEIK